ncbi:hypothetical protein ALC57_03279 [Trachymyrmex cornetzi]|uniref:Uncharacterized protein n=1 Tax=Trachymyrmex cornetzi TaxID=471704 RepID=A0A195EFB4_9HYME|nr:hypothetical protein ALC57_03279 [Trachymyrmex cornetzi]
MSWDQILDLPYDLAFPILLPVVVYYRDDATETRCRSLSNSSRFSSSSFVLTLWSTNCSSCAILPVYINRTIPKIYLPNRLSRRPHSPYPCDPRFSFQQAARLMFVLSKLLKIVPGTAFFSGTKIKQKDTPTMRNHKRIFFLIKTKNATVAGVFCSYKKKALMFFLRPVFIVRSYIQDRLKYGLKKSRTNQKAALGPEHNRGTGIRY